MNSDRLEGIVQATVRASLLHGSHLGPIAHGWTTPEPTTCGLCALPAAIAGAVWELVEKDFPERCKELNLAWHRGDEGSPDVPVLQPRYDALRAERDALTDMAAQTERNRAYYHGLVVRIGESLGEPAYIADDETRSKDVLCAKVPELVDALTAEVERKEKFIEAMLARGTGA